MLTPWTAIAVVAIVVAAPSRAGATRIDIGDPAVLGSVIQSVDLSGDGGALGYEHLISEVRFAAGVYSYVYAIQTTPYFPFTPDGEPTLLSVEITGHAFTGDWGAIDSLNSIWPPSDFGPIGGRTTPVVDIESIDDGFRFVPERSGAVGYTVVYVQSSRPPTAGGSLLYTAENYTVDPETGQRTIVVDSFRRNGALVPTPEPASIALFGAGLVGLWGAMRRPATTSRNRKRRP